MTNLCFLSYGYWDKLINSESQINIIIIEIINKIL